MSGTAPRSSHRAWVEVDHDALRHNLGVLRDMAGAGKQVIAVVKANAYGHGAVEVSRTQSMQGAPAIAVKLTGDRVAIVQRETWTGPRDADSRTAGPRDADARTAGP